MIAWSSKIVIIHGINDYGHGYDKMTKATSLNQLRSHVIIKA
jgi:hypothetical protein